MRLADRTRLRPLTPRALHSLQHTHHVKNLGRADAQTRKREDVHGFLSRVTTGQSPRTNFIST